MTPPRSDAKQLIAALQDHGVAVKMLTGDALAVASEIARGVGLPNIKRMADLKAASAQADNKTNDLFGGADGFAEVFPEDKYVVVKQLQTAGAVEHARSQSLSAPYPPGASLSLVTWSQQRDAHWFGGKLPSALRSIETVTAGPPGATPSYTYARVFAAPEVKAGAPMADSARVAFIVAQEPAVMP